MMVKGMKKAAREPNMMNSRKLSGFNRQVWLLLKVALFGMFPRPLMGIGIAIPVKTEINGQLVSQRIVILY